ncbi:MAG: outer membrane beta-barrel protein [Ahrensia sp.]|nr:outer membrane beta-barrel protein [Ahrensia sp.]
MVSHLPIWVLLGVLAVAVAATGANAQQTPLRQALDAEEEFARSGTQQTFDQFIDEQTGVRREPVFGDLADEDDDEARDGDTNALSTRQNRRQNRTTRGALDDADSEALPEGNQRARPAQQVGIIDATGAVSPVSNARIRPVQGGGQRDGSNPFEPIGIRKGSLLLFPSLTQTIGHTSNADFEANGESSAFSLTSARLLITSDWAVHSFMADVGGSYQKFFNDSDDLPIADGIAQLRIDHTRDFDMTYGIGFRGTTENSTSNNLETAGAAFVTNRPKVLEGSAFAQGERRFGRLTTTLRGTVTHTDYEDGDLSDGTTLSQADRTNTLLDATLRIAYETSPAFQPFLEGSAGWRLHEEVQDSNGQKRDSVLLSLRGGFAFDRGEKINGEIALGVVSESFDDPSLSTLSGLTVDGNLNWSPQRFTTVSATAVTTVTPSTVDGESGSITYAGTLGIEREVALNLTLGARVLASLRDYQGSDREDRVYQATLDGEWRLNRNAAIVGSLGYENFDSTDEASTYDAFTARLGVRLQH